LVKKGFNIQIEEDAGINSGYTNANYEKNGAKIVSTE